MTPSAPESGHYRNCRDEESRTRARHRQRLARGGQHFTRLHSAFHVAPEMREYHQHAITTVVGTSHKSVDERGISMRLYSRGGMAIFCLSALSLVVSIVTSDTGWTQAAGTEEAAGLAAWDKIAAVLQHPRCLNCHQLNTPLQGDKRRVHIPPVVRGADNMGRRWSSTWRPNIWYCGAGIPADAGIQSRCLTKISSSR